MKYKLSAEVFVIPHYEKYLLYVPLRRLALLVNKDTAQLLALIREGTELRSITEATARALDTLCKLGILNGKQERQPATASRTQFQPTAVTLFPTFDCNLRCKYCYSSGGEEPASMTIEIAKASIDLVCANAINSGKKSFQVNFHGGGEPTMNWHILVQSVDYARKVASEHGLRTSSTMASNCMLSKSQVEWVAANIRHVNASLDGPPEIQNNQRPTSGGGDSFGLVFAALKQFEQLGCHYSIRSTITQDSVTEMSNLVHFFCEKLKPRSIHLEPLFVCGRCLTTKAAAPNMSTFLAQYLDAQEQARRYGINLYYSGARLGSLTSAFCGASGRNFVVLPDGQVTSCNEVCRVSDPRSTEFFYGKYDLLTQSFAFDQERLNTLASRTTRKVPFCASCFLKWHCAGDCMAKAMLDSGDIFDPAGGRCWLNQEIAKSTLLRFMTEESVVPGGGLRIETVQL